MNYNTRVFNFDKMFNDLRESMYHGLVNESSLIYEVNDGKIKGELLVPGFEKEELTIKAHPKYLDISGTMEPPRYRRVKSTFHRKIAFTQRIDPDTLSLKLKNGVLSFEVSLEEASQVRIIDF